MMFIIEKKFASSLSFSKYSDKNFDKELRRLEKSNLINSIAQGYDNELRVIQTFDIINLKDKLNTNIFDIT